MWRNLGGPVSLFSPESARTMAAMTPCIDLLWPALLALFGLFAPAWIFAIHWAEGRATRPCVVGGTALGEEST